MLTKKDVFNQLQKQNGILKQFGVSRLGLFGSFVRNKQNKKSDLDFLVEFLPGKKSYDNFIHLSFLKILFNVR